jgi:hypothetical protein
MTPSGIEPATFRLVAQCFPVYNISFSRRSLPLSHYSRMLQLKFTHDETYACYCVKFKLIIVNGCSYLFSLCKSKRKHSYASRYKNFTSNVFWLMYISHYIMFANSHHSPFLSLQDHWLNYHCFSSVDSKKMSMTVILTSDLTDNKSSMLWRSTMSWLVKIPSQLQTST